MSIPHPTRRTQSAYFLLHKTREIRFRLSELLNVCETSRWRFAKNEPPIEGGGQLVNFHFSALSSIVQTIKDLIPVISEKTVTWTDLSNIRHMQFMHSARNAITHDGNPVVNMWADGRYYIAIDFLRLDRNQNPVSVKAPLEDIETLSIQFTMDLCSYLKEMISPLLESPALTGPLYGAEFFDNAIKHPAVPEFVRRLYAETDRPSIDLMDGNPVTEVLTELNSLVTFCHSRQQELLMQQTEPSSANNYINR
ncbi:hypothetical protein HDC36_001725 [Xanthomonas sp. JAI131]|uniref:hypothetical protein n=1 Tax=Xanthomonas sp. JAI131 TaxID=2723067 RepID=UPI0015C97FEF|nr:hypothetical protein [Xanthomonas sp. JAI131]NYF20264.1 hypothetical protein [Xanthomonas sp. JAI131]